MMLLLSKFIHSFIMASAWLKLYWFTTFGIMFFFTGYMMLDIFLRENVLRRVLMIVVMTVHLSAHLIAGLLFEDVPDAVRYDVEYRESRI